jgi:ribonuclease VapC
MASCVLDASAVIALLRGEAGALQVSAAIGTAVMSAVNVQEVYAHLLDGGASPEAARQIVDALRLDIRPHDQAAAWQAAGLSPATPRAGPGDRSCMALAIAEGVPALTADRAWAEIAVPGLDIRLIR